MDAKKKPIVLDDHDDSVLRSVYFQFKIPRDQYKKRPEDMVAFTETFNRLSGRNDLGTELIRYIRNKQKAKRRLPVPWPTFNGDHQRAPALTGTLDDDDMAGLLATKSFLSSHSSNHLHRRCLTHKPLTLAALLAQSSKRVQYANETAVRLYGESAFHFSSASRSRK